MKTKIRIKDAMPQVELMVAQGKDKREIATAIGCKVSSLRTMACLSGISLRPAGSHKRSLVRQAQIEIKLLGVPLPISEPAMDGLRKAALTMGTTAAALAADLLEVIATDNLYDAVLDREDA